MHSFMCINLNMV